MLYQPLDHTPHPIRHVKHDLPTLSGLKYNTVDNLVLLSAKIHVARAICLNVLLIVLSIFYGGQSLTNYVISCMGGTFDVAHAYTLRGWVPFVDEKLLFLLCCIFFLLRSDLLTCD